LIQKNKTLFLLFIFSFTFIFFNCQKNQNTNEELENANDKNLEKYGIIMPHSVVNHPVTIRQQEEKEESITWFGEFAVDKEGNIFVADNADKILKKINVSGMISRYTNIKNPYRRGPPSPPTSIVADGSGNLYLTISIFILKIDEAQNFYILLEDKTWKYIDFGNPDRQVTPAEFNGYQSIAVDILGNLYIAIMDAGDIEITRIDTSGEISIVFYEKYFMRESFWRSGELLNFTADIYGNLFVADKRLHKIIKIDNSGIISDVAGGNWRGGFADGQGMAAEFNKPASIAIDSLGNIFVADLNNNRIRKIDSTGMVSTHAGDGTKGNLDGETASAQINSPISLAIDGFDNIYVRDGIGIRKIDTSGMVSTVFATGW
jgi:hypothetical protein